MYTDVSIRRFTKSFLVKILILCSVFLATFSLTLPTAIAFNQASSKELLIAEGTLLTHEPDAETVHRFEQAVRVFDPDGTSIVAVEPAGYGGMILVTVSNEWYYQPYQIREHAAQNLWKMWAIIYSPENSDHARIKLLDLNGNRVGGSSILGGSLVDVDK